MSETVGKKLQRLYLEHKELTDRYSYHKNRNQQVPDDVSNKLQELSKEIDILVRLQDNHGSDYVLVKRNSMKKSNSRNSMKEFGKKKIHKKKKCRRSRK